MFPSTRLARYDWMILPGGSLRGSSTITQQYIKVLYLNSEQTLTRKYKELFLAYKINKQLSKDQIIEGYLNTIYFGKGTYGVQAASKAYFRVTAKDLTVPQAASSPPSSTTRPPTTRMMRTICRSSGSATPTCSCPWRRPARSRRRKR